MYYLVLNRIEDDMSDENKAVCESYRDSMITYMTFERMYLYTAEKEYGISVVGQVPADKFDAVILAVAHKEFLDLDVRSLVREGGVVYDVKGVLDRKVVDARL